ncbi:MAG: exosortase/archaeosortase family protein [Candidatus Caenarcaniphilales bacterium]|nr:exosortase/archaeosortase family protein [Candidatus Caenarcaniphilales bacterium]
MFPSAKLASFFINDSRVISSGWEVELLTPSILIKVTEDCSGLAFFSVTLAIILFFLYKKFKSFQTLWMGFCTVFFLVYLTTIIANSTRIVSAFYIKEISHRFFSVEIDSFLHFAVGTMVFLTFFVLIYLLLERLMNVIHKN